MLLFLFITTIVLMVGLSVAMLTFLSVMLINKYRRYLQTIELIAVMLFAVLLLIDVCIYRSLISAVSRPSGDVMVLDGHPFPSLIMFSLNWHVPFMILMIFVTLIWIRNIKKNVYFWVTSAIAALLVCAFYILSQQVYSNFIGEELHTAIWWL